MVARHASAHTSGRWAPPRVHFMFGLCGRWRKSAVGEFSKCMRATDAYAIMLEVRSTKGRDPAAIAACVVVFENRCDISSVETF